MSNTKMRFEFLPVNIVLRRELRYGIFQVIQVAN